MPKAHHPEQIAAWNQNRRPLATNRQPAINDLQVFIAAFQKWWDAINPPWCLRVDGRLKIGGVGPWESLHKPGQNGFLSVLQILSWWRGSLGKEGTEDWNSAVEDVAWVLGQVLHSQTNSSEHVEPVGKRARDNDAVDETGVGCENSQKHALTPRRAKR